MFFLFLLTSSLNTLSPELISHLKSLTPTQAENHPYLTPEQIQVYCSLSDQQIESYQNDSPEDIVQFYYEDLENEEALREHIQKLDESKEHELQALRGSKGNLILDQTLFLQISPKQGLYSGLYSVYDCLYGRMDLIIYPDQRLVHALLHTPIFNLDPYLDGTSKSSACFDAFKSMKWDEKRPTTVLNVKYSMDDKAQIELDMKDFNLKVKQDGGWPVEMRYLRFDKHSNNIFGQFDIMGCTFKFRAFNNDLDDVLRLAKGWLPEEYYSWVRYWHLPEVRKGHEEELRRLKASVEAGERQTGDINYWETVKGLTRYALGW